MPVPHAVVWFVAVVLVIAAVIDGRQLRVPNWLTFPFALSGLAAGAILGGGDGVLSSAEGLVLGLVLLLPLYAIGGMGAGDVKLLAGVGAWIGPAPTLGAFVATTAVGGLMALVMVLRSGRWAWHLARFQLIAHEVLTVRDPVALSAMAAERKPTMLLLPYGIPMAVGSILYFAWAGMLG